MSVPCFSKSLLDSETSYRTDLVKHLVALIKHEDLDVTKT